MKYRFLTVFLLIFCDFVLMAQPPEGYYSSAEGLSGSALKEALHLIIKNHTSVSYSGLWQSFFSTDVRPDNGKLWDIYSDNPDIGAQYYFTLGDNQCGNYSGEGDCYNREHSVPKSWFGGSVAPMYTDLFHLYPTDGYVNAKRGNLPLGEVLNATWTSTNGSKIGNNSYLGYNGQVFEPIDSFKGDLARTYFYMTLCYKDKNLGVETQSMFSMGALKPWALNMFLEWCESDPVSQKEIDRNNAIYQIQHNRNPFIDFPELAKMIFGSDTNTTFSANIHDFYQKTWTIFPNPARNCISVQNLNLNDNSEIILEIFDIFGNVVMVKSINSSQNEKIDISRLKSGLYFLELRNHKNTSYLKFIKQ